MELWSDTLKGGHVERTVVDLCNRSSKQVKVSLQSLSLIQLDKDLHQGPLAPSATR